MNGIQPSATLRQGQLVKVAVKQSMAKVRWIDRWSTPGKVPTAAVQS